MPHPFYYVLHRKCTILPIFGEEVCRIFKGFQKSVPGYVDKMLAGVARGPFLSTPAAKTSTVKEREREGLLTNAKVYIHVTIRIKVCYSDNKVIFALFSPVHNSYIYFLVYNLNLFSIL